MNSSAYFKGKVIIITGASSGIGLASARLFGSYGAKVVAAARRLELLEELGPSIAPPENLLCVRCDVSKESDCKALIDAAIERFSRIDVLVNNAGLSMRAMLRDVDLKVLKTLMDVNFWGTVYCTKAALPHLLKSRGTVAGVISIAGLSSLPARSGYSSSKFAVRGFLDALRIEHLKDGLNVLVFAPGYTSSNVRNAALTADGSQQGTTPLNEGRLMSAEKVALKLANAIKRRRNQVILTALGKITVFLRGLCPSLLDRMTYSYIAREGEVPKSDKNE
jgi:NADP-dependent 3-hydroxy acid dehydrogenase YdfG